MSSVEGVDDGVGYGVVGRSSRGGNGVIGESNASGGVIGSSTSGAGVGRYSNSSTGVFGFSIDNEGMFGLSFLGFGVRGYSHYYRGMFGETTSSTGVAGRAIGGGYGVFGYSDSSIAVSAYSPSYIGIYSSSDLGYAAYLDGRVYIHGPLEKSAGRFKIDHPLDPANKYLSHSFVESPDMKNVYDGVVILDDNGEAEISLPDWFGALNKDFRYQLLLSELPDRISILKKKYLRILLQTTATAIIITTTTVASRLQAVL